MKVTIPRPGEGEPLPRVAKDPTVILGSSPSLRVGLGLRDAPYMLQF